MEGQARVVEALVKDPSVDVNATSHTGETALHVVLARSADGAVMKPISHNELECPVSAVRERRKVAKPAKADAAAADAEGAKAA